MTDDKVFIAIDPGKNGGIAWHDRDGVQAISMPETVRDLVDALRGVCVRFPCFFMECVIERVHAMPSDGSAAAFAFGENFGALQGVLALHQQNQEVYRCCFLRLCNFQLKPFQFRFCLLGDYKAQ